MNGLSYFQWAGKIFTGNWQDFAMKIMGGSGICSCKPIQWYLYRHISPRLINPTDWIGIETNPGKFLLWKKHHQLISKRWPCFVDYLWDWPFNCHVLFFANLADVPNRSALSRVSESRCFSSGNSFSGPAKSCTIDGWKPNNIGGMDVYHRFQLVDFATAIHSMFHSYVR